MLNSLGIVAAVLDESAAPTGTHTASGRCSARGECKAERVVRQILVHSKAFNQDRMGTPVNLVLGRWSMPDLSLLSHYHPVVLSDPKEDWRSVHDE